MSETATQDFAAMAAPCEHHERLQPFEGEFLATVKMWMGPGDPHVMTGTMKNTFHLGNRYLHQDYVGDAQDGPFPRFEGKGYWGFNKTLRQYEGFWIDSASTSMQIETGQVDASGNEWTMTSKFTCPQTKQVMDKRTVIRLIDNDHHSMESYFAGADGNEFKAMEIQYTRSK